VRSAFRLGSIAGIGIHIDWSLLIIFVLITTTLAAGVFPAWHPQWPSWLAWATAFAAALLFFTSVLAHELSHALVGRAQGVRIERITLFVFGGVAQLEREPHGWRAELLMAIAGPLTSLTLGIGFLALSALIAGSVQIDPEDPAQALRQLGTVPTLLLWLGQVNVVLALFNLVPGFPLDGGRVLRALMWGVTGNLRKATRWASSAGQAFAWLLIAAGFAMLLGARIPLLGGGPVGGLWLAFIGWFLNNAALVSYRQLLLQEALQDVPVSRLMQTQFATAEPDSSLDAFVDRHLLRSSQRAFPVVGPEGLEGMVGMQDVRKVDRSSWQTVAVREVMTPLGRLATASPSDDALEVLARLAKLDLNQMPVIEQGELRGLVRREDILKWLALYADVDLG